MRAVRISNRELANLLEEIGQMLSLRGENRFKVIAYENAATVVRTYPKELADVYEEEGLAGLEAIEGVGEGIGTKIEALLTTGELPYYDRLKKKTPEVELELLGVTGIGPKTARKLYVTLKPESMADLKKKLKSARAKKYFGEKTLAKIGEALKERRHERRALISDVLPVALRIVGWLRRRPEVVAADPVGSLRRRKETIGDIDLVCASTDREQTIAAFAAARFTRRVVAKGTGLTTIVHESGFQVDLELVDPRDYGSLLQHFTGGKEHNVALRTWAGSRGLSLSEDGITSDRTGKTRHFATEEAFYQALGMDCPPPELRENRGEIEAAREHALPHFVTLRNIRGNLHMHTTASDGQASLEQMVQAAHAYGYDYIAVTDHSQGAGRGLAEPELAKHRDAIRRLDRQYAPKGLRVFAGVEVNIRPDGSLDVSDDLLASLDFVIASVHSSFRQPVHDATRRVVRAIKHPYVDCLGHPEGRKLLSRDGLSLDWDAIYRAAAQTGTLLEINAFPDRLDLADTRVQAAKEYGVQFSIAIDAHRPEHFDLMEYGVSVARRGWLEKRDIINTKTARQFARWLAERRSG